MTRNVGLSSHLGIPPAGAAGRSLTLRNPRRGVRATALSCGFGASTACPPWPCYRRPSVGPRARLGRSRGRRERGVQFIGAAAVAVMVRVLGLLSRPSSARPERLGPLAPEEGR